VSLDVYLTTDGCEHCGRDGDEVFNGNITHNLGEMATACGLYYYLWRPEEIGITTADQLIDPLTVGLDALIDNPEKFRQFNPSNDWGTYEGLIDFVTYYLKACKENPKAKVSVWR